MPIGSPGVGRAAFAAGLFQGFQRLPSLLANGGFEPKNHAGRGCGSRAWIIEREKKKKKKEKKRGPIQAGTGAQCMGGRRAEPLRLSEFLGEIVGFRLGRANSRTGLRPGRPAGERREKH